MIIEKISNNLFHADCSTYLNDNLYCIKCKKRISGNLREKLLKYYVKNKFIKYTFSEEIYHLTPSHKAPITYKDGCTYCPETIPESMGILLSLNPNLIPNELEGIIELNKILEPYKLKNIIKQKTSYEVETEDV